MAPTPSDAPRVLLDADQEDTALPRPAPVSREDRLNDRPRTAVQMCIDSAAPSATPSRRGSVDRALLPKDSRSLPASRIEKAPLASTLDQAAASTLEQQPVVATAPAASSPLPVAEVLSPTEVYDKMVRVSVS